MAIPKNIEREHVFQAMHKIQIEGVPNNRKPREWAVTYENQIYPCKLLISWANLFANGKVLDPNPRNFTTYMAQAYLKTKGFIVIPF